MSKWLTVTLLLWVSPVAAINCPVTLPQGLDSAEVSNLVSAEGSLLSWGAEVSAWHGSTDLAVLIPKDGIWLVTDESRQFRDKSWWWRAGYDARQEPRPAITVMAKRLDAPQAEIKIDDFTAGYSKDWNSMLALIEFPSAGCWQLTGTYRGHSLTFVTLVKSS